MAFGVLFLHHMFFDLFLARTLWATESKETLDLYNRCQQLAIKIQLFFSNVLKT